MQSNTTFPLYTPVNTGEQKSNLTILSADLRKKTSTLAFYNCIDGNPALTEEKVYQTEEFSSFADMVKDFTKHSPNTTFDKISVGVPGPVMNGKCQTINLPWMMDAEQIKSDTGAKSVHLINDLEAVAYSLAKVPESKFEILHTSENKTRGNVAVLAPGNGLGEAGLFWDGTSLRPFATEGGHSEFSPRNDFEVEFYQFLNKIYGIVSWENVLSKEGLYNIYRYLRDIGRHQEDSWLTERIQSEDFLTVISSVAQEGNSRLVNLTLELYLEFLAREANNLVLKLKATGGLIITGEITDKIFNTLDKDKFYKDFKISDRMEYILKDIPLYIMRNEKEILDGTAYFGAYIAN